MHRIDFTVPSHANSFCVVKIPDAYGDYAMHRTDCTYIPETVHCNGLGMFETCADALTEARKHFIKVNACRYCTPECHQAKEST